MADVYGPQTLQSAAAVAAVGLASNVNRFLTKTIEISTTGLSGTIDIQGSVDGTNFFNCRYASLSTTAALAYVVAQLSYTTDTTRKFFTITDYLPYVRVKLTSATAGSVTVKLVAVETGAAA